MRRWGSILVLIWATWLAAVRWSQADSTADEIRAFGPAFSTIGEASVLPAGTVSPTAFIDICSQHAQVCPVDQATWQGEPGGWQRTGKRWQRHTGTPTGINVMWEWSAPYGGSNPAYATSRENPYADYSTMPDKYPTVTDTPTAYIYDWERWAPAANTYKLYQFGLASESTSPSVGESDCTSGVYYPVTDHTMSFAYTPMSVTRQGHCASGGYVSSQLVEMWGAPRSLTRIARCDEPLVGIPVDQSPKGNALCKYSPYVGLVYQRYVWGAGPSPADATVAGCEAAIYAWGWPKPSLASNTGQDYQSWFRNGEIRLSQWLNLSDQVSPLPSPDDQAWWNAHCARAWSGVPNWLYNGVYLIGNEVFTDSFALPATVSAVIPASGGSFTSTLDNTVYVFPAGTFSDTVILTQTVHLQSEIVVSNTGLISTGYFFGLEAVDRSTGKPAQSLRAYTITLEYSDMGKGAAIESTLALYYRDGAQWIKDPTSAVFTATKTIVATPGHLSAWAVLGETHRLFVPVALR